MTRLRSIFRLTIPQLLGYYSGRLVSVAAIVAVPLSPSKSNKPLLSPFFVQPCCHPPTLLSSCTDCTEPTLPKVGIQSTGLRTVPMEPSSPTPKIPITHHPSRWLYPSYLHLKAQDSIPPYSNPPCLPCSGAPRSSPHVPSHSPSPNPNPGVRPFQTLFAAGLPPSCLWPGPVKPSLCLDPQSRLARLPPVPRLQAQLAKHTAPVWSGISLSVFSSSSIFLTASSLLPSLSPLKWEYPNFTYLRIPTLPD
ncbi:uncharacterized protein BDZ83DRAFT_1883 [Colletotrichum acutatum]|uniref:Uncharacterized protein n=1 Tax=Glomerella acutata TaxID=27357 RepID=A0AAD8XQK0_GLOAC|nr:uncharacterized protein BDZ83DRAFT_1883 [Colletotrichum acutatum]KAK1731719.1 hypothetical protein BDZ83DRAFT_1883 [Colletotrichum acutatum]